MGEPPALASCQSGRFRFGAPRGIDLQCPEFKNGSLRYAMSGERRKNGEYTDRTRRRMAASNRRRPSTNDDDVDHRHRSIPLRRCRLALSAHLLYHVSRKVEICCVLFRSSAPLGLGSVRDCNHWLHLYGFARRYRWTVGNSRNGTPDWCPDRLFGRSHLWNYQELSWRVVGDARCRRICEGNGWLEVSANRFLCRNHFGKSTSRLII